MDRTRFLALTAAVALVAVACAPAAGAPTWTYTPGGAAGAAAPVPTQGGPAPTTDVEADPNAPAYTLYPADAPALLEGETHDIDLVIEEKLMTVGKGFVQAVWTFNGTVPGPVIRVKVGDTIRVHLVNPATSKLAHSIDFHASQVAWNDEMTSINPGEEKVYEWRADYAGVWMYHCGTSPALHHIANGMYGMIIVEPKGGLEPVAHEFALVQNEWYLGPPGGGPVPRPGRDRRVHVRRRRPLPDRHSRLQLRRSRRARPVPGRRWRPTELAHPLPRAVGAPPPLLGGRRLSGASAHGGWRSPGLRRADLLGHAPGL